MRAIAMLVLLATACSGDDEKDTTDTGTPADTDTDTDTDTDADADTDADTDADADTDTDTDTDADTDVGGGEGFFAELTIDGVTHVMDCPGPDDDFETPYLVQFYAGDNQSIGCALDNPNGLIGRVVAITFDDRYQFVDGPIDETWGGGAVLGATGDAYNNVRTDFSANFVSFELDGTYDSAENRITGSFSAEFAPSTEPYEYEATVSGTFDMVLPD